MMRDWICIIGILLTLLTLFAGVWWSNRRHNTHPEISRKTLHIGSGTVLAILPFVFDSFWPVLTITGMSLGALLLLRFHAALRFGVGHVIHDVNRRSFGDVLLFIAAALLFSSSLCSSYSTLD